MLVFFPTDSQSVLSSDRLPRCLDPMTCPLYTNHNDTVLVDLLPLRVSLYLIPLLCGYYDHWHWESFSWNQPRSTVFDCTFSTVLVGWSESRCLISPCLCSLLFVSLELKLRLFAPTLVTVRNTDRSSCSCFVSRWVLQLLSETLLYDSQRLNSVLCLQYGILDPFETSVFDVCLCFPTLASVCKKTKASSLATIDQDWLFLVLARFFSNPIGCYPYSAYFYTL